MSSFITSGTTNGTYHLDLCVFTFALLIQTVLIVVFPRGSHLAPSVCAKYLRRNSQAATAIKYIFLRKHQMSKQDIFMEGGTDIHQNVFRSRLISKGHFFRLHSNIFTKDLNNYSPCCPSQSRTSNAVHTSIDQSSDSLLTTFPVCGKVHFLLTRLPGTARANNVHLRRATCQFGTWQRFPDLSKSSLVSNREMHLLIYLAMHWQGFTFV